MAARKRKRGTLRRPKRPTKGALIKGMSKRLPAEILADASFKEGLHAIMKGFAGVYVLYHGDRPYYVGLTRNLRGRVNQHLKDRHKKKWDGFSIFRIKRVAFLKDLETLLVRVAEPPGNRSTGHVPKDSNLNRILRKIHRQRVRALRRIERAL